MKSAGQNKTYRQQFGAELILIIQVSVKVREPDSSEAYRHYQRTMFLDKLWKPSGKEKKEERDDVQ